MSQQQSTTSGEAGLSYIEQKAAPLICKAANRPTLRALSHELKTVIYFKPRCKSWKCPACAELNKRLWTARIHDATAFHLAQGETIAFTTLTTHEKLSPEQSWRLFGKQWSKLRQRARRKAGGGEYVMIPEAHQSGKLHVHMLDTFALPTRWWKDNGRSCGLGYMAESEFAETPGGAARYAAKYLGKSLQEKKLRNVRRIRKSQGFLNSSDVDEPDAWQYAKMAHELAVKTDIQQHELAGYKVLQLEHFELYETQQKIEAPE